MSLEAKLSIVRLYGFSQSLYLFKTLLGVAWAMSGDIFHFHAFSGVLAVQRGCC